jgi:hypothetical protein
LVPTEVVVIAWAYQSEAKELAPMPEPVEAEGRQWQGRRRLQGNNFATLANPSKFYLKSTKQVWRDNQLKKPGARSRNGMYPVEWPTSSLLSTIALSPLPIKMEMSSPGLALVLAVLREQKRELPLQRKPQLKVQLAELSIKECAKLR